MDIIMQGALVFVNADYLGLNGYFENYLKIISII